MNEYELKYFECLSEKFKNKKQVLAEIINLKAIMNLPKGTEHFVSDIHGEYEMYPPICPRLKGENLHV